MPNQPWIMDKTKILIGKLKLTLPRRESERLEVGQGQVQNWGTESRVCILGEETEHKQVRTNEELLGLEPNNKVDISCHL